MDLKKYVFGTGSKSGYINGESAKVFNIEEIKADYLIYCEGENTIFRKEMLLNEKVFGLGQTMGSINKRGRKYRMFSTDDPNHTPQKESLYGVMPFLFLCKDSECNAILFDYGGEIEFDVGFNDINILEINIKDKDFDVYLFKGKNPKEIIKILYNIVGTNYIPPKWAFGFQQSRWSYPSANTVKDIVMGYRKRGIPLDAVYMDIDYMEHYKIFTVDNKKFPDFKKFVEEMNNIGINLVPIIDPGVKIEKKYDIYEEGKRHNYFCKDKKGRDYTAAVWPGEVHFPDFLNEKTRKWWGEKYKILIDAGIRGFWNDMNEPAIFYSPKGIKQAFRKIFKLYLKTVLQNLKIIKKSENGLEMFLIKDQGTQISNNIRDYSSFYHKNDSGKIINHKKVHNLYGINMVKATADGIKTFIKNERYLLMSRSSFPGIGNFAGVWTGDNASWWEHLILNIRMVTNLNMCGIIYTGADTGGFTSDVSCELIIRWHQLSSFMPYFRNHSAMGTREQEPWKFDDYTQSLIVDAIKFRYKILPYIYSEYLDAIDKKNPLIKNLFLDYEDEEAYEVEDQFIIGKNIMAAPVINQNSSYRTVYIPDKSMAKLIYKNEKIEFDKIVTKGYQNLKNSIDEISVYLKENGIFVTTDEQLNYVGEKEINQLTIYAYIIDGVYYNYIDDDGINGETYRSELGIEIIKKEKEYIVNVKNNDKSKIKKLDINVIDSEGKIIKIEKQI